MPDFLLRGGFDMKIKILILCSIIISAFIGCSKLAVPTEVLPSSAASTATTIPAAQITQTAIALQTAGVGPQQTATMAAQQTAIVVQQTATAAAQQTAAAVLPVDATLLVSVPGGTFTQTDGTNSFSHTISAFKIGKYEVTYDLWYTVHLWAISNGYTFANAGMEGSNGPIGDAPTAAKYEPVTTVSWRDVIVWCNAYSEKSGLAACYTYSAAIIRDSRDTNATACDNAVCTWSNNGYRLPSEGEWQYAASYKDGSSWTPYNYASGATANYSYAIATGNVAWYSDNSWVNTHYITHNAGGKNANALGIYDMSGNVFEWCWDWYAAYPGTSTNYRGAASGSGRVIRGGSYDSDAYYLQVGNRYNYYGSDYYPYGAYGYYGFRFTRTN